MNSTATFWMLILIATPTHVGGPALERFEVETECLAAGEALAEAIEEINHFLLGEEAFWKCVPVSSITLEPR